MSRYPQFQHLDGYIPGRCIYIYIYISYTEMMLVEIRINRVMFPDFGAQLQVDCGQIQRAKADPSVVGFLPVGVSKQRGRLGQMVSPFMLFTPKDWIWGNFSWGESQRKPEIFVQTLWFWKLTG